MNLVLALLRKTALIGLLTLAGCQAEEASRALETVPPIEAWATAFNNREPFVLAFYHSDTTMVLGPDSATLLTGEGTVRRYYEYLFNSVQEVQLAGYEARQVSDTSVVVAGVFNFVPTPDDDMARRGPYEVRHLFIFERPAADWKIVALHVSYRP